MAGAILLLLSAAVYFACEAVMNAGLIGRGVLLVGLVHGSACSIARGLFVYHSLGANLAIFGGNIASIVVGALWRRLPAPRWFGVASIMVGALGFVSLGLLALRTPAANTIPAAKHMEQR
jgi:hypothetical protein